MTTPSVSAEAPPGWLVADVAKPVVGGGSGATFTQWRASQSPQNGDVFLVGCVATPIPGWVEDMRPSVQARTTSLAAAAAAKIVGEQVEFRDESGQILLRPVGASDDVPRVGAARTFLGWDAGAVVSCFATCATPRASMAMRAEGLRGCDPSVASARLEGSMAPPPPGLVLGAVTWAVHHPSTVVPWAGVLAFSLGGLAVLTRRRQRSRI